MTPKDLDFETIPNWLSSAMTTHSSIVRFHIRVQSAPRLFFLRKAADVSLLYDEAHE